MLMSIILSCSQTVQRARRNSALGNKDQRLTFCLHINVGCVLLWSKGIVKMRLNNQMRSYKYPCLSISLNFNIEFIQKTNHSKKNMKSSIVMITLLSGVVRSAPLIVCPTFFALLLLFGGPGGRGGDYGNNGACVYGRHDGSIGHVGYGGGLYGGSFGEGRDDLMHGKVDDIHRD